MLVRAWEAHAASNESLPSCQAALCCYLALWWHQQGCHLMGDFLYLARSLPTAVGIAHSPANGTTGSNKSSLCAAALVRAVFTSQFA